MKDKRAVIVIDCRPGGTAAGKKATIEGVFPHFVIVSKKGEPLKTLALEEIDAWLEAERAAGRPEPTKVNGFDPRPDYYWTVFENIRLRLEDGSEIWGEECYWAFEEQLGDKTLAELQEAAHSQAQAYRKILEALEGSQP